MMAMHAKCVQTTMGWTNLEIIDPAKGIYGSGWWDLTDDEVAALRGGWIYFHDKSTELSTFAGRIEGLERRDSDGFAMLRVVRQRCNQRHRWRGAKAQQSPREYRRLVEATYQHELTAQPLAAPAR